MGKYQLVDAARLLHLHHVAGAIEHIDPGALRGRSVRGGDDPVVRAPNYLHGLLDLGEIAGQYTGLPTVREQCPRERCQRLGYTIEALVSEDIVDELSADESRLLKQLL